LFALLSGTMRLLFRRQRIRLEQLACQTGESAYPFEKQTLIKESWFESSGRIRTSSRKIFRPPSNYYRFGDGTITLSLPE
jgi:hypothetical protein